MENQGKHDPYYQNPEWPTNRKRKDKRGGKAPEPDHHHDLRAAQGGKTIESIFKREL